EDRRRRVESIQDIRRYIPETGFFPEYVRYWMPSTDAPAKFHLGGALSVASTLMHRKVWLQHGANKVRCGPLWIALLAGNTKLRKSTCVGHARETLPVDYLDVVGPDGFTVASLLQHMGITAETKEDLARDLHTLREVLAKDPDYRKGVGFFAF